MTDNNYSKNDAEFTGERAIIGFTHWFIQCLLVFGVVACLNRGCDGAPLWYFWMFAIICAMFVVHVVYCLINGFFELIKHVREIRNELVALRIKSGATATTISSSESSSAGSVASTRYDKATHQYVKA